jgi:hAT family C-terminal dimerisation region
MPRPRGKKPPSQHHQARRGTTSQQRTDDRQPGNPPFDPEQYTNTREVDDDTESVEDVDLSRWERKRLAVTQLPANLDMLHCFQQEAQIHPVRDVVGWWYDRLHDPHWKDLARMALTYLTLPAMSAEPERVFSGAKITLSDRRCRMGDDVLEAVECLKSWQRDGMIAATKEDVKAIEQMLAALCEEDLV